MGKGFVRPGCAAISASDQQFVEIIDLDHRAFLDCALEIGAVPCAGPLKMMWWPGMPL